MRARYLIAISALTLAWSPASGADGTATIEDGCGDAAWPVTVEGGPAVAQPGQLAGDYDIETVSVDAGVDGTVIAIDVCGSLEDPEPQSALYTATWTFAPPRPGLEDCTVEVSIGRRWRVDVGDPWLDRESVGTFGAKCYLVPEPIAPGVSSRPSVEEARVTLVPGRDFTIVEDTITVTLDRARLGDAASLIAPGTVLTDLAVESRTTGLPPVRGEASGVLYYRTAVTSDVTRAVTVVVRSDET